MSEFEWVAVALVVVLSSARLTRLLTVDKFPPTRWLRDTYANITDGSGWQLLFFCGYCMSFWMTVLVLGTGYASDWHTYWWLVNGTLGGSYLAAIVMAHDGDDGDDD